MSFMNSDFESPNGTPTGTATPTSTNTVVGTPVCPTPTVWTPTGQGVTPTGPDVNYDHWFPKNGDWTNAMMRLVNANLRYVDNSSPDRLEQSANLCARMIVRIIKATPNTFVFYDEDEERFLKIKAAILAAFPKFA
jgi:hypothetical protein